MKIYAAAIRIVNGTRQQVVKIHNHRQRHDQPRHFPSILEEKNRYKSGNQKVKDNVKSRVDHEFEYAGQEKVTLLGRYN